MSQVQENAMVGCLLGTAVGDAVGLACEGLTRQRQAQLFPLLDGPCLLPGRRSMVSDDTEHTYLVAQALVESAGEPGLFERTLARRLREWLFGLPAGTGWATLRATTKLAFGVPPAHSGVFSAGNGPAMRSALLGVCFGDEPERLRFLVHASTRLTHTDPRAEVGALAVGVAAHVAAQGGDDPGGRFLQSLAQAAALGPMLHADELLDLCRRAWDSVQKGEPTWIFAGQIGAKEAVSGYVYQTVPIALHAWMCHPHDCRAAILEAVHCGGDTDTTGAIAGAITGAGVGKEGIPAEWLAALWEWPRTTAWMEQLGTQIAQACTLRQPQKPLELPFLPVLGRNIVFAVVVIAHGLRRLLSPY